MADTPSDMTDASETESTNISVPYKALGEFSNATDGATGLLGYNSASSGATKGVEGRVDSSAGYGLSTPDDARIGGTAELSAIAGGVTASTLVSSLTGDGLTIASNALALGPTSVQTDTASTFGESGVSVTHSDTAVIDSAIKLASSVTRPADHNSTEADDWKFGIEFEPQADISEIEATISSNTSGESTVYIYDGGGTQLASEPSPGAGNAVTLTASMAANTKYYALVDDGGNQYTSGYYDSGSFPYTSPAVDITSGAYHTSTGVIDTDPWAYGIAELTAPSASSSGTATVAFPRPSSVRRWETASF